MSRSCVAIHISNDESSYYHGKPLMLQNVMFCPALTWCTRAWTARGIWRFFLVCEGECPQAFFDCFPKEVKVEVISPADWGRTAELLYAEQWQVEEVKEPVMPLGNLMIAFQTVAELNQLQVACHDAVIAHHQSRGVRIMDPATAYIDPRAEIGEGTLILPNTILRGETIIGEDCEVGPNAMLTNCKLHDRVLVNASQVEGSELMNHVSVGPYAHIRPGCVVGEGCHIGAFVQLKNCNLGAGTKLAHLTYVGDADVGDRVNFGCGTVTSNYDGFAKHRTVIGDDVFIGCNTNLVPPVTVESGAYIAAGTTVTRDVPADALAVGRARQENKAGWAKKNRELKGKK